jgi:hypothetical protein
MITTTAAITPYKANIGNSFRKELFLTWFVLSDVICITPSVDAALKDFYEEAVHDTVKQTGIKENVIRDWCEDKLITTSGTRSIIHQEYDSTGGLSNEAVSVLASKHLIREESRFGATWIELTHDRLIDPIKTSNKEWRVEQERLRYEQEKERAEREIKKRR